MFDVALRSVRGFVTGKLFANPKHAYGLLATGVGATTAVLLGAAALGLPLPAAAAVAAFAGGLMQPRLYKNLKYR